MPATAMRSDGPATGTRSEALVDEATGLLQGLIRNRCVNDGSVESGQEIRNADLLEGFLRTDRLVFRRFEPAPGRVSLLARLEGSDPSAPRLLLLGHTDVVPATPSAWRRDPFGGELVDGEVWGRGAADMLSSTATMAVALRELARRAPMRGTLLFLAEADEEAGGALGAGWITQHEPDAVRADYVLTEAGFRLPLPARDGAPLVQVATGERGLCWCRLRVTARGGHGSMPFGCDNATVKIAEFVRRLVANPPPAVLGGDWRAFVEAVDPVPEIAATWHDVETFERGLAAPGALMPGPLHNITHTTITPTVLRSGTKVNVVPNLAELDLDVRMLPGHSADDVRAFIRHALGDLADEIRIDIITEDPASASAVDTPLFRTVRGVVADLVPGSRVVPSLFLFGSSDARFFRRLGATAYGAALMSDRIPFGELARMLHGIDERMDLESLRLMAAFWIGVPERMFGSRPLSPDADQPAPPARRAHGLPR